MKCRLIWALLRSPKKDVMRPGVMSRSPIAQSARFASGLGDDAENADPETMGRVLTYVRRRFGTVTS